MDVSTDITLQQEVDAFLSSRPGGERLILLIVIPSLLAGTIYGFCEYRSTGGVQHLIFIALLCIATLFIGLRVQKLRRMLSGSAALLFGSLTRSENPNNRSRSFLSVWLGGASSPGALLDNIFNRPAMAMAAVVYGTLIASSAWWLGVHKENLLLQVFLAIFLFAANSVTGALFYSIIAMLRQSWSLAKRLDITLFDRHSKASKSYTSLLANISITAALYIGLCQASVLFSPFSGMWVYVYGAFAALVFIAIYYLPQVPIRSRLAKEREEVLFKLDQRRVNLLNGVLSSPAIDELSKLNEIESRILKTSVGLSRADANMVKIVAVASALIPYVLGLLKSSMPELVHALS